MCAHVCRLQLACGVIMPLLATAWAYRREAASQMGVRAMVEWASRSLSGSKDLSRSATVAAQDTVIAKEL